MHVPRLFHTPVATTPNQPLGNSAARAHLMEESPGIRPWGVVALLPPGNNSCTTALANKRREDVAKLEREALRQLALELCVHFQFGRPELSAALKAECREKVVPTSTMLTAFRRGMETKLNLVQRFDPATSASGRPDGPRTHAACDAYLGTYKTHEQAMAMGNDRISLTPMRNAPLDPEERQHAAPIDPTGAAGEPPDWWLGPCPGGMGYVLPEHAYGEPWAAEPLWDECLTHFHSAHEHTQRLIVAVQQAQLFDRSVRSVASMREAHFDVGSYEQCLTRLKGFVNRGFALRQSLMARVRATALGRAQLNDCRRLVARAHALRAKETGTSESLIFTLLTASDHWQEVFEDFSATDASRFMQVYLGQCARGADGQRVVDADIVGALRRRFPRLHIYTVTNPKHASERFPHHTLLDGAGEIYKDKLLHIPIGMVTSRLRTRVRAEDRAKTLQEGRARDTLYELPPLHEADHGDSAVDPGYRKYESTLLRMVGDMTDPVVPMRRVKNNGWSETEYALDPDHQLTGCDPLRYFHEPPVINVVLVHATSRAPVVPGHPHGGLQPQDDLKAMAHHHGRMRLCAPSRQGVGSYRFQGTHWWVPSDITTDGSMSAVLAKFWPTCLTNNHSGAQFRIVVTCTGQNAKRPEEQLIIKTETEPYTFYANKRVGKRPASAASPSGLTKRPR